MPKIVGKFTPGDADGILMQTSALLDPNFNKTQEELNRMFGSGQTTPISQKEYNAISPKENRWYFIFTNGELQRIYYANTLICRKAQQGESVNASFPLEFPFVFA